MKRRFGADTGESTYYDQVSYATIRTPTSRGLFGSKVDDRELLFAVQREPAAFRIVFGVARDTLDNWFTVEPVKEDKTLNDVVQKELDRLQAKTKLIKLLSLSRLFGYSLLLLGYDDSEAELKTEMSEADAKIRYIEPYSKLEINRILEVDDAQDERDGYPKSYFMKKSAGLASLQTEVHHSRALLCSTLLVDHRYKGWSALQCLYDDITGYRYMRWGIYMTMIRYGSGFPDVTLKGPDADQAAIDAFIASGQFDNLSGMKYFVHNEQQQLEFKGFQQSSLNPLNYYQIALETLSMGSGIPEPVLKGSQAGAITGSEVNERNYFKVISDEQTAFEPILRQLIDKILLYLGKATEDAPVEYNIIWKPNYEPTAKEKAELDYLNAQTAQIELQFKTVDEVRKDRYKLPPLANKAGAEVVGLRKPEPQPSPRLAEPGAEGPNEKKPGAQASPAPEKEDGNPAAQGADASEAKEEKSISRTLPTLMRELGQAVMDGKLSRDSAYQRGKNMIVEYSRLEQEQALLWVKHRTNFPGVVIVPPEMQKKLDAQHKRFLEDLNSMLADAEAVFKKTQIQKPATQND